jgi:two-component system LytT family response regulator
MDEEIEVKTVLRSVKDGIEFLRMHPEADLILSDIQLSDGLSFQIFEEVSLRCPVIFVSAYDQYLVNAFEYGGIDYLLKPVSKEGIGNALSKYRSLQKHFLEKNVFIRKFLDEYLTTKKTRVIVKKGASNISLLLSDVVFFYTENLVVYVYDNKGNKYLIDKSLNSLENELDHKTFFRANRQYILNINYVQGYKNYERVKLLVSLTVKDIDHMIIVGQEKAKNFRHWLAEA